MPTGVSHVADLHFGQGHVGANNAVRDAHEKQEFAARLQTSTLR